MDTSNKRKSTESRMSDGEEEKTEEEQSIPEKTRFHLLIWPNGECRLVRFHLGQRGADEWDGPVKDLPGRLAQLNEGYVELIDTLLTSDGKYFPSPLIDTVETLLYHGHFKCESVLDFPKEALTFPRLERLIFRWVNVRSIPPEILETKVEQVSVRKVQEPPLFLLENPCEIEWVNPLHWEPGIEDQLKPFKHLRQLLLLGLGQEEKPTPWSSFLKLHRLHDPRLFLLVAEFLK